MRKTPIEHLAYVAISVAHTGSCAHGQHSRTYTLAVSNVGIAPANAPVTIVDSCPTGLTAPAAGGGGWICDLGAPACMRGDALAPAAGYDPLLVTVSVWSKQSVWW